MRVGSVQRLVIVGLAVGGAALFAAAAGAGVADRAARLAALDPGARVGGNTVVFSGTRGTVRGVPGRSNFMIGLGANETIVGAHAGDQLGAFGRGGKIVAGAHGHQLLVPGPGGTVVAGGAGHDLVFVRQPGVTVRLDSRADKVALAGRHDRLVCSNRTGSEKIYTGPTDAISQGCRGHHNRILPVRMWRKHEKAIRRSAHAAATPVTGDGTNTHPYTRQCATLDYQGSFDACTIEFPPRTLTGLWSNEFVPSYMCPLVGNGFHVSHLERKNYAPAGTSLVNGVEVRGLGPVGVSITGTNRTLYTHGGNYWTLTGSPWSSATNWTLWSASYQVVLHCVTY